MPDPKVVSLQPGKSPVSVLPPIVSSLCKRANDRILPLLKELLDGTDDALFEMADRSQSNADHHLYFDSMRQIRLNRADIERRFAESLEEGFESAFAASNGRTPSALDTDAADMNLVAEDDLEISVAVSGITSKITSQFSLPIMELTKRLDHVAKHATINERSNPLGPQRVSEAFAGAIDSIDVDIKIRIILLKLFERLVMQRMGPIYEEANRAMSDAGVLKDLRRSLGRARNPHAGARARPAPDRSAAGPGGSAGASAGSGATGGYGSSQGGGGYGSSSYGSSSYGQGAAGQGGAHGAAQGGAHGNGQAPGQGGYHGAGAGPVDGAYAGGGFSTIQGLLAGARDHEADGLYPAEHHGAGSLIATPALVDLLTSVQNESSHEASDIEHVPALVDLRQVLVSRAPDVTGQALNHLGRADEDVVNFIGMLFDYILNDRNLAIPMKALIARLQIPVVKLAIIDKSFFDRSAHPARQLLNELSSVGIGWSSAAELKRDAVYDMVESVVVRVLNGFSSDPGIFDALLAELREFRSRDTARHTRMEQRVKETESGRARTLTAKQEVQRVINQKVCGLRLPHEIGRFLSDVWSRALVYLSLREGPTSSAWESLIVTLDDLLWSLQPLDAMEDIERRDDIKAGLLDRLSDGMQLIQIAEGEQQSWLTVIAAQLQEMSQSDRLYLEDDDSNRVSDAFDEMEEIVLAAPHEVTDNYQGDAPEPDFVDKINKLAEGCWVEIRQSGGQDIRCKLATIVRPGDRYVFVNRRGMKVAEKTRMELARELQDEKLVVLDDSQVFDRALQAVIGNLRQIQNQSGTSQARA